MTARPVVSTTVGTAGERMGADLVDGADGDDGVVLEQDRSRVEQPAPLRPGHRDDDPTAEQCRCHGVSIAGRRARLTGLDGDRPTS